MIKGRQRSSSHLLNHEHSNSNNLGNTRVTFKDKNNDALIEYSSVDPSINEVSQINHYYPFGLNMERPGFGAQGANKYQYNSKELNSDFGLNWNDYGARFYDAAVARWGSVDIISVFYPSTSSYAYVENNPIGYKDIEGNYKFPVRYHNDYKTLTAYLRNNVLVDIVRSPMILAGLLKYSGNNLTMQKVTEAATWDSGPTIEIIERPDGGGNGSYDPKTNTIYISKQLADQLETSNDANKLAALTGLYKTLLHETTHYGDYLDGQRQVGGEPGDDFDNDLYFGYFTYFDGKWNRQSNPELSPVGINTIEKAATWFDWKKKKEPNEIAMLLPTVPGKERRTSPPTPPLPIPKPKPVTPLPKA